MKVPILAILLLAVSGGASPAETGSSAMPPSARELDGAWSGEITHDGETTTFAIELETGQDGKTLMKLTVPIAHVAGQPIGRGEISVQGSEIAFGPFAFHYDREAGTLAGTVPEMLAPVYRIPVTLRRVARLDVPARPRPEAPLVAPVWTFDAGAPLWAGATFANGVVYAGGDDGRLHAVDGRTGRERWSFRAGGPIRARAAIVDDALYLQADDGFLYRLDTTSGQERWRVRVALKPIARLPFDDPKSRYDRFGSDVTVAGGRLYLGTHDGRVLALDPTQGTILWEVPTGDSVVAAPAVAGGRVYFGSFDNHVYAVEADTGRLAWKRDTKGAVVSTPALDGERLVIGNRAYDVLGLDPRTGDATWKRYVWFSWIESSATIRDHVAYVGSSDAAAVYAFEAAAGRPIWKADVFGWSWGQPAVTATRVYAATSSQVGYLAAHEGGAMALDRATGRPVWRYVVPPARAGTYGFPGSPAVGDRLVFFTGLDGRVYAFEQ